MTKEEIAEQFENLQALITEDLALLDQKESFKADVWTRKEGGGGRTMTLSNGGVIEKGGVAFSKVYGEVSDVMRKQLGLDGKEFFATGVSIVLHPSHPFVPIIHMNVRYFELDNGTYWFGGGIDLTPHYIDDTLARQFHVRLKNICDKYSPEFYTNFKKEADQYFFIPHRNETRGVGGIFFDHQIGGEKVSKDELFSFCMELGKNFPKIYAEQAQSGLLKPFDENHIDWRNHRRGRYVEFNLVNDRGTKFGLLSGGRTESILMSLPPLANWTYCKEIAENSLEKATQEKLIQGYDWLTVN